MAYSQNTKALTTAETDALFLHVGRWRTTRSANSSLSPVQLLDALELYSRKPDCFRRAVSLIRVQCSELDMDENARVKGVPALGSMYADQFAACMRSCYTDDAV